MPRKYRIVLEGEPHHVVQRGNRRQQVFFHPHDKEVYLRILEEKTRQHGVSVWAYCLMDNHVHLVLVPTCQEALAKAVGETNRRFTTMINKRNQWRGYLWQGRFISSVMDNVYLTRVLHYVENNPVRAGMVTQAWNYPWSSAKAHVTGETSSLLEALPEYLPIKDWKNFLQRKEPDDVLDDIRKRNRAGLPMAADPMIDQLAQAAGISPLVLKPRPVGRPPRRSAA